MFDFVTIEKKIDEKKKTAVIYPSFLVKKSKDLMTKGKTFYAVWDEETGLWSKDENRACELIDKLIDQAADKYEETHPGYDVSKLKLLRYNSKRLNEFQSYCKAIPDNFIQLDSDVTFANEKTKKEDYRSKTLMYSPIESETPYYDELISTLYSEEERQKIEWAIGSIISGDSKVIQKFYVFYGEPGSGKSTILKIISAIFDGYCATFDARAIGNALAAFALEPFKDNPLVAIQDDGDLFHIEDNTRLNSIASHESLVINEKHKATYTAKFNSVMFIGTNKPVRITDAKSGVIRRLIDISPTGKTLQRRRYDAIMDHIPFEIPGIAYHCYEVYKSLGMRYYDKYKPMNMMGITNDFYNFIDDNLDFFLEYKDRIQLKKAWIKYKEYCVDANIQYPFTQKAFKEELKNYFDEFHDRKDGERKVYCGFQFDKFDYHFEKPIEEEPPYALTFNCIKSRFDTEHADYLAQYANSDGTPLKKWDDVTTKLCELDTSKLHYVLLPETEIVIDFDLKNDKGEKDFQLNLEAASKWPATYAELSKSGAGIHLHYIYTGDPSKLSRIYDEDIEIKVFTGKSSLRRCLTKCNNLPIAKISSGLPLKGDKSMVNFEAMKNEKQLRALIRNCLEKKHHGATTPEVYYIKDTLDKCYNSGMHYDVTDMRPLITAFANNSSNQALTCLKLVKDMKFRSEEPSDSIENDEAPIIFFDCEVFPNLFIICWKFAGEDKSVVKMINPSPADVENLFKYRLIGFNNRRYDNHILYARSLGDDNKKLFKLSSMIVAKNDKKEENRNCFLNEAYKISYTDIYDYASNDNKMSLKKWEIKLGIHHLENEYAWDQDVDPKHWDEIADYCANDVIATEAVFNATQADFKARCILAELSGLTVNDTTNQHTTKLIVGNDKNPQSHYIYPDLSKEFPGYRFNEKGFAKEEYAEGAKIVNRKSIYMGEDPSEGGYAVGYKGIYTNVALLDVASMHPSTIIALNLFGDKYTANFKQIKDIRLYIKHKEYDKVREMFDGKLTKYLTNDKEAKALSTALKTAINSVYGLTSASFPNKLRDPRNVDNVVAKRGALFMITLKNEVIKKGFKVAHVKTDSIKIADATPEIIQFVMDFGKKYGYDFEHEATYERMCIVNHSVYIAKYADGKHEYEIPATGEKIMTEWTATGEEFQGGFIFKTLFSHDPLIFKDYCMTASASKGSLYLDKNETLPKDEHNYKFIGRVGEFVPVVDGCGGGELFRIDGDKASYVGGTKGFRWLDSETVKSCAYEDKINVQYFTDEANKAIEHINEFGDFEWFVSDDKDFVNTVVDGPEEIPFEPDKSFPMNPPEVKEAV